MIGGSIGVPVVRCVGFLRALHKWWLTIYCGMIQRVVLLVDNYGQCDPWRALMDYYLRRGRIRRRTHCAQDRKVPTLTFSHAFRIITSSSEYHPVLRTHVIEFSSYRQKDIFLPKVLVFL